MNERYAISVNCGPYDPPGSIASLKRRAWLDLCRAIYENWPLDTLVEFSHRVQHEPPGTTTHTFYATRYKHKPCQVSKIQLIPSDALFPDTLL